MDVTRNPRYIAVLAISAGLILGIGWRLKPGESVSPPVSAPSQVELSRLPSLIQRRSMDQMTEFFAEAAADLGPALIRLPSISSTGVLWSSNRVVTARLGWRFPAVVTVTAGAGDVGGYAYVAGPHLPFAAVRVPGLTGRVPPQQQTAEALEPGEWVLAAWRTETQLAFTPGSYVGTAARVCGDRTVEELVTNLPIRPTMLGGGVFDLDGTLFGVLVRCDDADVAVTTRSVSELIAAGDTWDSRLRAHWGIHVRPLTAVESFHFGLRSGLLVHAVWEGYPGAAAGLRPGDVLWALDGGPLRAVEDLRILDGDAAPDQETFSLGVRRGVDSLLIALPARGFDLSLDMAPAGNAGLVWEQPPSGYPIASVLRGSRAAEAGIAPGDRLVRLNHVEPESLDDVQAVLADDWVATVFVELARDGRHWGVWLP